VHEVGAAYSAGFHLYEDFVWFDSWFWDFVDLYVVGAVVCGGFHFVSLVFWVVGT